MNQIKNKKKATCINCGCGSLGEVCDICNDVYYWKILTKDNKKYYLQSEHDNIYDFYDEVIDKGGVELCEEFIDINKLSFMQKIKYSDLFKE